MPDDGSGPRATSWSRAHRASSARRWSRACAPTASGSRRLVRRPAGGAGRGRVADRRRRSLDPAVLEGAHAVVGMNGASIGRFPWTRSYKSTLLWSRITPTRTLATAVKALGADAPAFVSASAVGLLRLGAGAEAHRILAARRVVPRRPVRRVGVRRARPPARRPVSCSRAPRRSCIRAACSSRSCC